jgi:formate dehydrogenase major subunit
MMTNRHHGVALDRRRARKNELIDQDSNLRGVFYWGHAPNSQTRGLEMKKAMDKLDLLVVVDPYHRPPLPWPRCPASPKT